jgi:ABC-type molybdate transport system substrate-binding protein
MNRFSLPPGGRRPTRSAKAPLIIYCAAGLKPPVETTVRAYERAYGIPVQLQSAGGR